MNLVKELQRMEDATVLDRDKNTLYNASKEITEQAEAINQLKESLNKLDDANIAAWHENGELRQKNIVLELNLERAVNTRSAACFFTFMLGLFIGGFISWIV